MCWPLSRNSARNTSWTRVVPSCIEESRGFELESSVAGTFPDVFVSSARGLLCGSDDYNSGFGLLLSLGEYVERSVGGFVLILAYKLNGKCQNRLARKDTGPGTYNTLHVASSYAQTNSPPDNLHQPPRSRSPSCILADSCFVLDGSAATSSNGAH